MGYDYCNRGFKTHASTILPNNQTTQTQLPVSNTKDFGKFLINNFAVKVLNLFHFHYWRSLFTLTCLHYALEKKLPGPEVIIPTSENQGHSSIF